MILDGIAYKFPIIGSTTYFPRIPRVRWLVGWSAGRTVGCSAFHNFLKGREVTLPCFYQSTCLFKNMKNAKIKKIEKLISLVSTKTC